MGLKVIASMISKRSYYVNAVWNDLALKYAKSKEDSTVGGMVFALVTWKQQDDERWFGAKSWAISKCRDGNYQSGWNAIQTTYKIDKGEN
ncbi:hypothetical protein CS542_09770 [Pedobacter sp. IW39]|nr:hypothetical protein CS542_09770 [Pedobacter sp. IW39]